MINPIQNQNHNRIQDFFIKNWINYSKNDLFVKDQWKTGNFKINSKKKPIIVSDIPILFCFENLQKNQKQCKLDVNLFSTNRRMVFRVLEEKGKGHYNL
jgi:hypothetical protein